MLDVTMPAPQLRGVMEKLRDSMSGVVRGKETVVRQVVRALAAGGHVLVEDLPGLGKTTLAYALARATDCAFTRVQFTSDLLPSDVIGVPVYEEQAGAFVFKKGPVFTSILLADEINRTTPKTQSALLEVMERGKVTVDGQTYAVPRPFMVVATQNPVDWEGTFPLPESQLDRFLMRLEMGYADFENEVEILAEGRTRYDSLEMDPVVRREEVLELQRFVPRVYVEASVLEFLVRIGHLTREAEAFRAGVSTRGLLALKLAAQATALGEGRAFVIPEDVLTVATEVLGHRLSLKQTVEGAQEERAAVVALLRELVERADPPL